MTAARWFRFVALAACIFGGARARPSADQPLRLPAPAFPAVVDLYQQGHPAEALTLLERQRHDVSAKDIAIAAGLLRARLLSAAGRFGDAAVAWEEMSAREPVLERFARRSAFEDDLRAGNLSRARATLDRLTSGTGGDETDLFLMLAASYRARKSYDQAAALYQRVLSLERDSDRRDAALVGLASVLEAQGNPDAALAALRRAEIEHHDSATFVDARAAEGRIARSAARAPAPLACRDAVSLARRLRLSARYREALDLIEPCRSAATDAADREAAEFETITDLYLLRDNDQTRSRAARFLVDYPASLVAGRVRLTQFRLAVREGQTDVARRLGTSLWRQGAPGLPPAERRAAARLLAAYLVSIGTLDEGIAIYTELSRPAAARADRVDTLWRGGVASIRAGQPRRARTMLRQALVLRPGPDTAPLVDYWLGVAELALGNGTDGRTLLASLAGSAPFSYYGLRASERLGKTTRPTAAGVEASTFPDLSLRASSEQHPYFRAASLLALAGLAGEAATFARRLLQAVPSDRALVLVAARASAAALDHRYAYSLVVNAFNWLLQRPVAGVPEDLWSLAYPKAFWSEVEPAARAAGIDPLFLLSLMRQESGFDPRARSGAGAAGLFQVMPDKARELATAAGVERLDEDVLFEPRTNTRLATVLVSQLLKQFDGAPAPVAASFNAGEDRVAVWWEAAKGLPEDLFVDTIPYNETRRYVREVVSDYATYRRLYPQPRPRGGLEP